MPKVNADNPAGRLYIILDDVQGDAKQETAIQVWSRFFECEHHATIIRVLELHQLLEESILRARAVDAIPMYLQEPHLGDIRQFLEPRLLNAAWSDTLKHRTPQGMLALATIADGLSRYDPDGELSEDVLKSLSDDVNKLIEELHEGEVDPIFKEFALKQLQKVRHALDVYRLHGAKGLYEALESITGALVFAAPELEHAKKTDARWYKAVVRVYNRFLIAVTHLEKFKKLAEGAKPLLKMLGAGDD